MGEKVIIVDTNKANEFKQQVASLTKAGYKCYGTNMTIHRDIHYYYALMVKEGE